ncbi:MAG: sulfate adenylyltransferase, partial [Gammaproteobacteria bacterium]|nr:sulfate adenylyltransferase [Gammaproteobacteria bacterium]
MIKPHGSDELNPLFVYDTAENEALQKEAEGLASIVVSSAAAANAVMLGAGYFNPLTGYMNKADALSVATDMKTTSGLFWPTPVLNLVQDAGGIKAGDRIALKDPNVDGNPVVAIMNVDAVEEFSDADIVLISEKVYAPSPDEAHPGVDAFLEQGKVCLSGSIQVLNFSYFQ